MFKLPWVAILTVGTLGLLLVAAGLLAGFLLFDPDDPSNPGFLVPAGMLAGAGVLFVVSAAAAFAHERGKS